MTETPEGVVVTQEMWDAAWKASEDYFLSDSVTKEGFRKGLAAMLAAAPTLRGEEVERPVEDDGLPQRMLTTLLTGKCGVPRGHMEYNDECICGDRKASEALIVLGLAYSSDRWPMAGVFLTGIGESLKERMANSAFVKSLTASREGR